MERSETALPLWLTLAAATMFASPVKAGKPSKEPPPPPPVQYDVAWLDTSGYSAGYASDINANTLVGTLYPGDGTSHPFLLNFNSKSDLSDPSRMVDINTLVTLPEGYRLTTASRITTEGRIAGSLVDNNGVRQPYVYDPGLAEPLTIIPNPLGTTSVYVRDMNERGDVLFSEHRDPANTGGAAFLYTADTDQVHSLRTEVVAPMAINDNRIITGNFRGDIPGGLIREGSWDSYTFDFTTDTLSPIPGKFRPADIANDGTVAGEYYACCRQAPS